MAFLSSQRACLAMVFMQFLYAGMALLSKAALNKGMSHLVFVVYRQATATLTLAPFAYIVERWGRILHYQFCRLLQVMGSTFFYDTSCGWFPSFQPMRIHMRKTSPLSFIDFCKVFLLSLCGLTLSLDLYYMALRHTSATFASAVVNIIPVITFLITVLLRKETINLQRIYGQCKILGLILCVGGAVVLSLYQGPPLSLLRWHAHLASPSGGSSVSSPGAKTTLFKGPLLMFAAFISWSSWVVMQAEMLKAYPSKISLTALQCLLSTVQSSVIAVSMERNLNSWILGWNMQLFSVIYCGVFVSGLSYWLQIWCIEKKGPIYVAMFSPLSVLITAIFSALIWAELLYFGSVLGGALIVGGLYLVLWGKSKEARDASLENVIATIRAPKEEKMADIERG